MTLRITVIEPFTAGGGGGSGGSVWITVGYLRGHGEVSVRGGTGNIYGRARGGCGSGGRISAHILLSDEYRGAFLANGAKCDSSFHGGTGTIYVKEKRGSRSYRRLYLDNQFAEPTKEFVLKERNPETVRKNGTEKNEADFAFEELSLQGKVRIQYFLSFFLQSKETFIKLPQKIFIVGY